MTPRAIRLYEQHGFITPARDEHEVRFYDGQTVERLQHIAVFRGADLPLRAIADLLDILDARGEPAMRRRLLELLATRSAALDRQRRAIDQIRRRLLQAEAETMARSA